MKILPTVLALIVGAAALAPQPAAAQIQPHGDDVVPTIHVNANATVQRAPDVAVIQLAVETIAPTAREATDRNTALMEAVLEAVRGLGIPSSAIRTQRLELQPQYQDRRNNQNPEIIAYRALNQVTVRLDDVTATGPVVDAAVRAGANRVTGIHFELADPQSAYHDALREAITKARAEAEVVAAALGGRLGEPVTVSTGGFHSPPPAPMYRSEDMAVMAQAAPPPVEPGEVNVQANVNIVWRLET